MCGTQSVSSVPHSTTDGVMAGRAFTLQCLCDFQFGSSDPGWLGWDPGFSVASSLGASAATWKRKPCPEVISSLRAEGRLRRGYQHICQDHCWVSQRHVSARHGGLGLESQHLGPEAGQVFL